MERYRLELDGFELDGQEVQAVVNFDFQPEDEEAGSDFEYQFIYAVIDGLNYAPVPDWLASELTNHLEQRRSDIAAGLCDF